MKIKFNNKYDCKLTTWELAEAEADLGNVNPLTSLFEDDIPRLKVLITVFYHGLKACDDTMTLKKACDIFDEYCENEGGDIMSLSKFVYDLYKASGLVKLPEVPEEEETEGNSKN